MSGEPARWLESAEQPELLSLMRVGRDELAPVDVLARVGERLRASTLVGADSTAVQHTSRLPRLVTGGMGAKAVGAAVLLMVLGASLYLTLRAPPSAPAHVATSSAQQPALPPHPQPVAPPLLAPSEPTTGDPLSANAPSPSGSRPDQTDVARRPKKTRAQPRELPSSPTTPLVETRLLEAKLLEQARQELSARPDHALVLLRDHAAQFPTSWLEEERAALLVRALVATGQRTDARAQLTRFEARFPGSLHTQRLERALTAP